MPQIFVSYSRVDLAFSKRLIERIQTAFPDFKIWRDDAPHGLIGGDNWWDTILRAINDSDIFLYLLSNESVQSLYCQAEFTEARRLQKRIITVQVRDQTELTDELDDIQFIDMKNSADDPDAFPRLVAAINKQLALAKPKRPLWKPATPKPRKEPPPIRVADSPDVVTPPLERPTAENEALKLARSGVRWQIIGVVLSVMLGVLALAVPLLDRLGSGTPNVPVLTATNTSAQVIQLVTDTATQTVTASSTATDSPTFSATFTPTTPQVTLATNTPFDLTAIFQQQMDQLRTQNAANQTATADAWTDTPTPTYTSTENIPLTLQAVGTAVAATLTAEVSTATPSWTLTSVPSSTRTPNGGGQGKIAYHTNRDGNAEIYAMNSDGTDPRRLTTNEANDLYPVWSPNGLQIAFYSNRDGNSEIYVMNADGSNVRRLTTSDAADTYPVWSPNGTQIAFQSYRDGNDEIYIMNVDGTNLRNLTNNNAAADSRPAWSPDGRQIAFHSDRIGNYEIYVINVDGTEPRNLTNNSGDDYRPAWSPDGTRLAFTSFRDGNAELYVMNADGSSPVRLTNNLYSDYYPAWSPDGTQIAFTSNFEGNYEVSVINPNGSNLRNLTNSDANEEFPSWSP